MFGRATITLGIGPHSSWIYFCSIYVLVQFGLVLQYVMCNVVQGLLSFLSAPLIGALSDICGRKPFLLLTVTFTCVPIPLMKFSPW